MSNRHWKNLSKSIALAGVAALVLSAPLAAHAGSGSSYGDKASAKKMEKKDIVDTAVNAGSFNTLVAAVKAAGLVEALKGEGPFTVFAPTDEAFAALPAGTVENLLKPENKDQLTAILTYHVVSGKVAAEKAMKLSEAKTLEGRNLSLKATDEGLMVGEAMVVQADIWTSNGVIHVIDKVLLPPAKVQTSMNR